MTRGKTRMREEEDPAHEPEAIKARKRGRMKEREPRQVTASSPGLSGNYLVHELKWLSRLMASPEPPAMGELSASVQSLEDSEKA
jgi:hypothetical protein